MRIVSISDTHNQGNWIPKIPNGDVLVHAGDHTGRGFRNEMMKALGWLERLKDQFENIILIAGNHDFFAEKHPEEMNEACEEAGLIYLHDESTIINGVKFYGSPYQPWFHDWAFNLRRGEPLRKKWAQIPEDTDVLITHGPPVGLGDRTQREEKHVGCVDLLNRIAVVKPKLHIFGHIHEGYGVHYSKYDPYATFVNASTCTLSYQPENPPIVVDILEDGSVKVVEDDES